MLVGKRGKNSQQILLWLQQVILKLLGAFLVSTPATAGHREAGLTLLHGAAQQSTSHMNNAQPLLLIRLI